MNKQTNQIEQVIECIHCKGTGICKQAIKKSEYRPTGGYHGADEDPNMEYFYWYLCPICGKSEELKDPIPLKCENCKGKGYILISDIKQ